MSSHGILLEPLRLAEPTAVSFILVENFVFIISFPFLSPSLAKVFLLFFHFIEKYYLSICDCFGKTKKK
jgi:hypothetical protein